MQKEDSIYRSPWKYDVEPFHIADNVYYVGNSSVSIHLFDTSEGVLLLDTGYPQTTYLLLESIRKAGFKPENIRWILHSHAHIDHFGATRMLVEKFGCKTYMPQADIPLLNEKSELNWCDEADIPYTPPFDTWFDVDFHVISGDVLSFGNMTVTAYSAAGHTPGTMAYVFSLPSGLRAAMHGGIGWNTLKSDYIRKHNLGNSWREAYINSMNSLENLEVDIVLGNHPNQAKMFQKNASKTKTLNPFIDKNEWGNIIRQTRNGALAMFEKDPIEV